MSQNTQDVLTRFITALLTLAFGVPSVASWFGPGTLDTLTAKIPGVVAAAGTIITFALLVVNMWPKSKATKVALAGELPDVSRIVTTQAIASSPAVKALPDVKAQMPTVVTHPEAIASSPPVPTVS